MWHVISPHLSSAVSGFKVFPVSPPIANVNVSLAPFVDSVVLLSVSLLSDFDSPQPVSIDIAIAAHSNTLITFFFIIFLHFIKIQPVFLSSIPMPYRVVELLHGFSPHSCLHNLTESPLFLYCLHYLLHNTLISHKL